MVLIVDLDLQQVVTGFGSKNPISGVSVKSQDTPTVAVYFTKNGANFSLGSSPGVRFGLFEAGNPNPLIQSITFTQTTDAQNRTCYVGYPNFNTVPLAAAIGSNPQLSCIGEIRYQTSFGTIARTSDIPFTVVRSLLNETILDSTQVAFTVPAVGSDVTIAIAHTSWLSAGLNLTIGNGAGAYQVVSITDANHFVAENQGGTGNAAPATVIPSGTSVGIAPAPVIPTYPDPSIIELTTHKGVANGYAGLDANTLVLGSRIPVDTQTIALLGSGKIGSAAILAVVAANFTTPATGATVSVTLNSSANLRAGSYVRIPIAGYYIVESITSGTVAVLQNNGDPFNAAAGATITSGAVLLPAQAAAGGGTTGQNAYTQTTASFTVPPVGSTVSVAMGTTSWLGGNGYYVFITGAGYYAVNSITDGFNAVLTNAGSPSNAPPGTVVPTSSQVAASGAPGATGASGAGLAAYDALAASFTMPAVSGTVTITIGNTAWLSANQIIYIATAGYLQVSAISSATQVLITNLNYPGNATAGAVIASGSKVSPGGLQGPQGAGGPGLNAFTTLSANFTQPAINANVTANVGSTTWMATGQGIFIQGGGYYTLASISDVTHAVVTNLGGSANPPAGSTITGSGTQNVTPAGTPGTGGNAYTTTSASFTQPAVGSSVTVSMASTAWLAQNQYVFIAGGGTYSVSSISSAIQAVLINVAATGNVLSGTIIPSGSAVSPSGPPGPQGATGPAGSGGGGATNHTQAVRTSNWTYASATVIPWTGVSWDTDTKWASGNPSRLTIVTAGYYLVTVQLSWGGAGGGATNVIFVNVTVNGSTHPRLGGQVSLFGSLFTPANQIISGVLKLNAGDYLEVVPWTETGLDPTALVYEAASGSSPVGPLFQLDYLGT
jgi:hypothetical protein